MNPPTKPDTSPLAPVTAIDPASVKSAGGQIRSVPRLDDGNPATVEEAGWQPLIATPNHPEYPSAHSCVTPAGGRAIARFLGTKKIDFTVPSLTGLG